MGDFNAVDSPAEAATATGSSASMEKGDDAAAAASSSVAAVSSKEGGEKKVVYRAPLVLQLARPKKDGSHTEQHEDLAVNQLGKALAPPGGWDIVVGLDAGGDVLLPTSMDFGDRDKLTLRMLATMVKANSSHKKPVLLCAVQGLCV